MSEQEKISFFRTYDLTKTQKQPKEPAAHQSQALGETVSVVFAVARTKNPCYKLTMSIPSTTVATTH